MPFLPSRSLRSLIVTWFIFTGLNFTGLIFTARWDNGAEEKVKMGSEG